jgi:phytoene dehydrogenase-like protein
VNPEAELSFATTPSRDAYDAIVVGSGPNGLAAAITIARAGRSVLVLEAEDTIGGGMRSGALTLTGYVHDICSTIHALGVLSPFMTSLPLAEFGLRWCYPEAAAAHPLEDGRAAVVERSVASTAAGLGDDDPAYRRLFEPLVAGGDRILAQVLGPLRPPRHPLQMMRFGWVAARSAQGLAEGYFRGDLARSLFAGMAAHSILPLETPFTAAVGLMLGISAHLGGWPVARGGSQRLADAMARYLRSLGGEIVVGRRVRSLADCPPSRAILFDVSPRQLSRIAGDALPAGYRRKLERFRYGPGVFKLDWALDGPIPWKASACLRSATVHVGGTPDEVAAAERAPWKGQHAERPFLLVAQQSVCDDSRAPEAKQTAWAYCHVPNGSTFDMTERIESQMERFAPGFRDRILARSAMNTGDFERHDENLIGGDITGGVMDIWQLFTRPTTRLVPYSTPAKNLFLCSASTPPGGGVHGMCGYHAARAVLRTALRD